MQLRTSSPADALSQWAKHDPHACHFVYYAAPRGDCFALGRPSGETFTNMRPFKFPWKPLYWFLCACVLVFLLAPIAAIIPLSFTSGSFLTYPLPGLSLRWYHEVLGGGKWLSALGNSLFVGVFATIASVLLGTLASLGLMRHKAWWSEALKLIALSPMIVPVILIAVPFVVVPVLTALELLDPNLARAAAACGAVPRVTFMRVTLPSIMPAMASGALFAFAASFDDVVIALLIAGPDQRTLPREMFSGLRDSMTPALTAVATIMIVFSTTLFMLMQMLQRRTRKATARQA